MCCRPAQFTYRSDSGAGLWEDGQEWWVQVSSVPGRSRVWAKAAVQAQIGALAQHDHRRGDAGPIPGELRQQIDLVRAFELGGLGAGDSSMMMPAPVTMAS